MDQLSLAFAEAAAIKAIENCDNIEELRKLAISVTKAQFAARSLLNTVMLDNLKLMTGQNCKNCPLDVV